MKIPTLKQMLKWFQEKIEAIKTISVLVFVLLFIIAAVNNGCQREQMYNLVEKITGLNVENDILQAKNSGLKVRNEILQQKTDSLNKVYLKTEIARDSLQKIISSLIYERDTLKDYIRRTPTSELYQWLDEIRFPYQGEKLYKFNEPQVNEITYVVKDYDILQKEKEILIKDVNECNNQLVLKDSILENKIRSQEIFQEVTVNQDNIIENYKQQTELTEKQVKKLKRQLFWWKVGAGVAVVAGVLIAI